MEGSVSRVKHLAEKIVMVGGLDGCGKTLFSPIISALDRVELPTYSYEVEHYCALFFLQKMSLNSASTLVKMQTDLKLYNTMMGREVNFRPTDLSSVQKFHNPEQYFERLHQPGDESVINVIDQEKPILNLTIHNVLFTSEPIWEALKGRCTYIEVVRHPLYMVRQHHLNMQKLVGDVRDFIIYYEHKHKNYPYWVKGWEDVFDESSDIEKTIYYFHYMTKRIDRVRQSLREKYNAQILTIPFEKFALNPEPWLKKIATAIGSKITDSTKNVMTQQMVPRDKVAQGLDIEIYRRCGWVPPIDGASEIDELNIRRQDIKLDARSSTMKILDQLCNDYEKKYWSPKGS
jgi:hypothetical protein